MPSTPVATVVCAIIAVAPVVGDANVTTTPGTGLLSESRTRATTAVSKAVATVVCCEPPDDAVTVWAGHARLVSVNDAGVSTPVTVATTSNVPAIEPAVIASDA